MCLGGATSPNAWQPHWVGLVPHHISASYNGKRLLGTIDSDDSGNCVSKLEAPAGLDLANLDPPSNTSFHLIGATRLR